MSPPPSFEEAVEIARGLLAKDVPGARASHRELLAWRRLQGCAPEAFLWWSDRATPPETVDAALASPAFAALLADARRDPVAHDALALVCRALVARGAALPPALAAWAGDRIIGMAPRPPDPRSGDGAKTAEHQRIVKAVYVLTRLGLTATESEQKGAHGSACHAVAAALGDLGLRPSSASRVRRLWHDHAAFRRRLAREMIANHELGIFQWPEG